MTDMTDHAPPLLLSYSRAAYDLGNMSVRQVSRLADRGLLTRVKVGGRAFVTSKSLLDLVDRLEAESAAQEADDEATLSDAQPSAIRQAFTTQTT
jgi:hypothetical protein